MLHHQWPSRQKLPVNKFTCFRSIQNNKVKYSFQQKNGFNCTFTTILSLPRSLGCWGPGLMFSFQQITKRGTKLQKEESGGKYAQDLNTTAKRKKDTDYFDIKFISHLVWYLILWCFGYRMEKQLSHNIRNSIYAVGHDVHCKLYINWFDLRYVKENFPS